MLLNSPAQKWRLIEIRGVDSGHLLRTLMEKELVHPAGKSDLPGKASLYKTSNRFLEVFGLNSLEDLPSEEELEELFIEKKQYREKTLQSTAKELDQSHIAVSYPKDERENKKIRDHLKSLPSTVEFLEKERMKKVETEENPPSESSVSRPEAGGK